MARTTHRYTANCNSHSRYSQRNSYSHTYPTVTYTDKHRTRQPGLHAYTLHPAHPALRSCDSMPPAVPEDAVPGLVRGHKAAVTEVLPECLEHKAVVILVEVAQHLAGRQRTRSAQTYGVCCTAQTQDLRCVHRQPYEYLICVSRRFVYTVRECSVRSESLVLLVLLSL